MSAQEKVNILLVDDQPAKLLSYETILAELGENLLKASSAQSALEILLRQSVAVMLIDVCMPELDGFELAEMIRQHPRFQSTAIIFVSAIQVTDLDLVRGYERGAVDYVPVPVAPGLLRAKVRVFAELYRKTRQLEQLNAELEQRVAERTAELERTNQELERRVEERTREREAALAQVHQMQKVESLGQLTGGIAHDFNNLLMAMLGHLEILEKRLPQDSDLMRLVNGAIRGAERGAVLTKRMLAFARRQELKPESVDVAALVDGMGDMLSRSLGPSIEIATEFESDLPAIRIDANQLELAILNLALNARDAMSAGGRLTIAARRDALPGDQAPAQPGPGRYVCVSVSDTGCGMDEATQKRAIEPFFTTKGLGKGTGLGLSMVDGLAAQSGGFLRIKSQPAGWTRIELWLPEAGREATVDAVPAVADARTHPSSYRVLVVDDDALVRSSTTGMLEDLGHVVIEVSSAAGALEVLRAGTAFDCVLTDHAMPGMTGMELAGEIRRSWPNMPVILATGYAELVNGEDLRCVKLAKPYRQQTLAAVLARSVGPGPIGSLVAVGLA